MGVCPYERYAPGTEIRYSKRDRETHIPQKLLAFRAYKNNSAGTSWAILLWKILSCELNSLNGVVCISG